MPILLMRIRLETIVRCFLSFFVISSASSFSFAQITNPSQSPSPLAVVEDNPANWKKFTSAEGGFSVFMPGTPTDESQQFTSALGNTMGHAFNLRTKGEYLVGYADYPWPIEGTARLNTFLNSVRDAGVKGLGGNLLEEKETSLDGHPGLAYRIEFGGGYVMNAKVFVVTNRLYLLAATTYGKNAPAPVAGIYEAAAAKFLASFQLTSSKAREVIGEVDSLLQKLAGKETVFGVCAASDPNCTSKRVRAK